MVTQAIVDDEDEKIKSPLINIHRISKANYRHAILLSRFVILDYVSLNHILHIINKHRPINRSINSIVTSTERTLFLVYLYTYLAIDTDDIFLLDDLSNVCKGNKVISIFIFQWNCYNVQ